MCQCLHFTLLSHSQDSQHLLASLWEGIKMGERLKEQNLICLLGCQGLPSHTEIHEAYVSLCMMLIFFGGGTDAAT